jgi:hypothetical protein
MSDAPVTQAALDRLEQTARRELEAHERLDTHRFAEVDRRLGELNNSHERALQEKQRTDTAALRVQENAVTKKEFQDFKEEHIRLTATQVGSARQEAVALAARAVTSARLWASATAVAVIIINLAIRYLTPRGP